MEKEEEVFEAVQATPGLVQVSPRFCYECLRAYTLDSKLKRERERPGPLLQTSAARSCNVPLDESLRVVLAGSGSSLAEDGRIRCYPFPSIGRKAGTHGHSKGIQDKSVS